MYSESEMGDDLDAEIYKLTGKEGDAESAKSETVELIHPNEVLKALRLFVDQHRKPQRSVAHLVVVYGYYCLIIISSVTKCR